MVEVITTDEFLEWFESLSDEHAKATAQVIETSAAPRKVMIGSTGG